ncbi:GtrA family protein [Caulobacter sp. S45]|uniref:GtrA family protein n=1 Tax=Caulobacter sp. S45 TaxID=1641861 RepID=UPI0015754D87|nr:GtrA family protein [Caulobacter sp. S45]
MFALKAHPSQALVSADSASVQAVRFLAAGACNTLFGYSVFALLTWLGAAPLAALVGSTAAGVAFNFQTSRRLVFRSGRTGRAHRFVGIYLVLLASNWAVLSGLRRLGVPTLAAQALLLLPFAAASFAAQRVLVFRTLEPGQGAPGHRGGPSVLPWGGKAPTWLIRPAGSDGSAGDSRLWLFGLGLGGANAAFLLGMLTSPRLGLCACALMVITLWRMLARPSRGQGAGLADRLSLWALALGLALTLCLLGGEGRIFYANTDWQIRDAVLADLSTRPWPVHYHAAAGDFVLRAPLGMYMLPALIGHAAGWRAAQLALLVQNTALLGGVLAVFMSVAQRWASRLLIAAVFVAFSGWDLIAQLLQGHFVQAYPWNHLFPSLETWAPGFQYSSLVADLFWAPNHAIPAWIMAATYVLWRRGEASVLTLAAITGLSVLWSPLAVMGAAPFVVLAVLQDLHRGRLTLWNGASLLPLVLALLPVALYVTLDGGEVVHGLNVGTKEFQRSFVLLIPLEVAPLLYLAGSSRSSWRDDDRFDVYLCAIMLVLIPFYRIGISNDFMMRASIFPITVLAILAARGFVTALESTTSRRLAVLLVLLAIGAATPAAEIIRAVVERPDPPRGADLFTAWEQPASRGSPKSTYVAPEVAYDRQAWLLKP